VRLRDSTGGGGRVRRGGSGGLNGGGSRATTGFIKVGAWDAQHLGRRNDEEHRRRSTKVAGDLERVFC